MAEAGEEARAHSQCRSPRVSPGAAGEKEAESETPGLGRERKYGRINGEMSVNAQQISVTTTAGDGLTPISSRQMPEIPRHPRLGLLTPSPPPWAEGPQLLPCPDSHSGGVT